MDYTAIQQIKKEGCIAVRKATPDEEAIPNVP